MKLLKALMKSKYKFRFRLGRFGWTSFGYTYRYTIISLGLVCIYVEYNGE